MGTIENSTTINMDGQILNTEPVANGLDEAAPASHVLPLLSPTDSNHFTVQWEAPGSPSDLRDYTVYVAEDGGPYRAWRQNTVATADTSWPARRNASPSASRIARSSSMSKSLATP